MNFIYHLLSERIINALGWTILHSLWQGFVIGVILFILLYSFRHHQPVLRYNLSVFSLFLIFTLCMLTFAMNFINIEQTGFIKDPGAVIYFNKHEIGQLQIDYGYQNSWLSSAINTIAGSISGVFPYIITIWLIGVFIITTRMTGGFYTTQRLRSSCLYAIPPDFQLRFRELMDRMKVRKLVSICESTLISIPVVIGYFKPMILLPFSAVSHIPCDQLDAIIAHELAHIRRHDYLVNIFQSMMEALLFFNPAVWFITYQIRKERENCCDDLAVSFSCDRITYAKALASMHEIPVKYGLPLLALGSKKYPLLSRVLRILKQSKMKTNLRSKILAGFLLISAIMIILLNTGGTFISFNSVRGDLITMDHSVQISEQITSANQINTVSEIRAYTDAEPEPVPEVLFNQDIRLEIHPDTTLKVKDNVVEKTFMKDGREMNIIMKIEQGKVKELYVNGEKIPEEEFGKYQAEIDKTLDDLAELEEELAEAREDLEELDMEEIRKEIEESIKEVEKSMKEIDVERILDEIEEIEIPEIDHEKIRIEMENAIAAIEDIDMEKIHEEIEKAMELACEAIKDIEMPDMEKIKIEMERARKEMEEIDYENIRAEIEKSISDIKIDREEIKKDIEETMKELQEIDMDEIKMDLEQERIKLDEMLKEIEKLELENK